VLCTSLFTKSESKHQSSQRRINNTRDRKCNVKNSEARFVLVKVNWTKIKRKGWRRRHATAPRAGQTPNPFFSAMIGAARLPLYRWFDQRRAFLTCLKNNWILTPMQP